MLRSVLRVASPPAVVLLNHYSWYLARGDGVSSGLFFSGPESSFNDLAQVTGCCGLWMGVRVAWQPCCACALAGPALSSQAQS